MSSAASIAPAAPGRSAAPGGSALRRLTVTELKLFVRERVGVIWGVGFPLVLLIIFGSIPGFRTPVSKGIHGLSILDAYVPILITFVLAMLALNALPSVLAGYREKGILRRLATTPVGPGRVLAAQLAVNVAVVLVTLVLLVAVARIAYGVPLPRQVAGFALAVVLTVAALFGIGMFVAAVVPTARAANAAGAILFFPMMFFAGLWLPIAAMPSVLQHISHATPLGAAAQSLTDAWQGHWPHPLQLLAMAAYALVFSLGAARLFRWE
jgi:ABC-2 type transport system permease protein